MLKSPLNQPLTTAFIVVGAIVIFAISLDYPGKIQMKLGVEGVQVQVDGSRRIP